MQKIKKYFQTTIIALMALVMMVILTPLQTKAGTAGHSADDAINWVKSKVGTGLDYDGVYGNQCVDLICYYYQYLGQRSPGGNGCDYAWNALPSGWQRIQGAQPQKGDILVYSGNSSNPYGHVAIYAADRETYHQNFNSHPYVEKVTYKYNGLSNSYWGVIRPDFSTQPSNNFTSVNASEITTSSAKLTATTSLTYVSECGYYIGTDPNAMHLGEKENPNANTLNIWYTAGNLKAGTTYYYQFYYISGGNVLWSEKKSFTTQGINLTGLNLSATALELKVGDTAKLTVSYNPANATNVKSVTFKSENGKIATVDVTGVIKAVAAGKTSITVTETATGISASCTVNVTAKEGWKKDSKGWWYQNADGSYPKNQWKAIESKWYHFDANGYMQTGWLHLGSKWYYLKDNGEMVTGWLNLGNTWYYLKSNGEMTTGWLQLGNTWYYLKSSGAMAVNEWVDNGKSYVDANGKYVPGQKKYTEGWKKDGKGWWYQNADGSYPKNQWKQIAGSWYHFDAKGYMQTGWYEEGYYIYYLKADGKMAANEWVENGKYYIDANGHRA